MQVGAVAGWTGLLTCLACWLGCARGCQPGDAARGSEQLLQREEGNPHPDDLSQAGRRCIRTWVSCVRRQKMDKTFSQRSRMFRVPCCSTYIRAMSAVCILPLLQDTDMPMLHSDAAG